MLSSEQFLYFDVSLHCVVIIVSALRSVWLLIQVGCERFCIQIMVGDAWTDKHQVSII